MTRVFLQVPPVITMEAMTSVITSYVITYSHQASICWSATQPPSICENSVCSFEIEFSPESTLHLCQQLHSMSDVQISVFATNLLGNGLLSSVVAGIKNWLAP